MNTAPTIRLGEFIVLAALMTSLVALSIDAMLPALSAIGTELGVRNANETQLVVTFLFVGLCVGQLLYGPLSDSFGRKPAVYIGLTLYVIGCLLAVMAWSFPVVLLARALQGLGAAAARIVIMAIVRDQYAGRDMARIMSLIMAVFIAVPALAPLMGQGILIVASWRFIFAALLFLSVVCFIWFTIRQPETLNPDHRKPFNLVSIWRGLCEILSIRPALGYILAAGVNLGAFTAYLMTAPQIFQGLYGLGALFPFFFGGLALAIGASSLTNSRLVMRYGMTRLSMGGLVVTAIAAALYFVYAAILGGVPPLWTFVAWGLVTFFCKGLLFGNLNALAMEPLGHIAGLGAAVVGSVSTLLGIVIGTIIGQMFDQTVLPLVAGFGLLAVVAIAFMKWAEKHRAGDAPA